MDVPVFRSIATTPNGLFAVADHPGEGGDKRRVAVNGIDEVRLQEEAAPGNTPGPCKDRCQGISGGTPSNSISMPFWCQYDAKRLSPPVCFEPTPGRIGEDSSLQTYHAPYRSAQCRSSA